MLEGKLAWRHPCEMVNNWVKNLKRAYDEETLREEAAKIGAPIEVESFRQYFSTKPESTESSPSKRHMGHYKAIVNNKDLVQLHTHMLNIGLLTGTALLRWKSTLSLMLEKDKGKPKLNRLRIIQLFEADYNFTLGLVFGQRLTKFASEHCGLNQSQYGSMRGRQCQSAVLNKILTYDIFRMTREDAASA